MKFVEQPKTGSVLGNEVKSSPVPFARLRAVEKAQQGGDATAVVTAMCGIISDFVTMADGEPIDADLLSPNAIKELFAFATGLGGGVADFT